MTPRSLALLVFRLTPIITDSIATADAEANVLNQQLFSRLNARYDLILTQTILHSHEREIYCVRFAIGSTNTTWQDVSDVWSIIDLEGQALLDSLTVNGS